MTKDRLTLKGAPVDLENANVATIPDLELADLHGLDQPPEIGMRWEKWRWIRGAPCMFVGKTPLVEQFYFGTMVAPFVL